MRVPERNRRRGRGPAVYCGNLARFLKVDPESALRRTNRKFRRRFQWMEAELKKGGASPREATLEQMDALWERAKESEEPLARNIEKK